MTKSQTYDPLALIPSAAALRKRLDEVLEQARRLEIVLKTAQELEDARQERQSEAEADCD